jgi:glycosyltransferase involved in cell wall biosynthesis
MTDRILHVTHSLNVGGLERVVVDLARGFKEMGYTVDIACLSESRPLGEEAEKQGHRVFSLGKKSGVDWRLAFRLAEKTRTGHYEIVHTHNTAGLVYGGTAGLLARVPRIIHTEHGKEPGYENNRLLNMAEHFLMRRVHQVVVVSEDLKNTVASSAKLRGKKIVVIPNGIAVNDFYQPSLRNETRRGLGIGQDEFVIGSIGRLVPLKNHRFLVHLLNSLRDDLPKMKLVIIGDGPMRVNLERECMNRMLSNRVLFLGERRDIPNLLSALDLFVQPSLTEGISITLIEAMAARKPILASDVGGNPEVINSYDNGILVSLDRLEEWVEIIRRVVQDKGLRESLSEKARQRALEKFSVERMVASYASIYQNGRENKCYRSCEKD